LLKLLLVKDPAKRLQNVINKESKELFIQNHRWFTIE
jgi:hypothetical protein